MARSGSEVVLSLERMRDIVSFHDESAVLVCEAGVVLQDADEFLRQRGFTMPIDLACVVNDCAFPRVEPCWFVFTCSRDVWMLFIVPACLHFASIAVPKARVPSAAMSPPTLVASAWCGMAISTDEWWVSRWFCRAAKCVGCTLPSCVCRSPLANFR